MFKLSTSPKLLLTWRSQNVRDKIWLFVNCDPVKPGIGISNYCIRVGLLISFFKSVSRISWLTLLFTHVLENALFTCLNICGGATTMFLNDLSLSTI